MALSLLKTLAPSGYAVHEGPPQLWGTERSEYEEEEVAIVRAVSGRKEQYRAARRLFREGLRELGCCPAPLLNSEDRAPIWPAGLIGSLTHTSRWCAVVVARAERICGIGVDVETDEQLTQGLLERIATPREVAGLSDLGQSEKLRLGKLIFSAKESLYKCQYPLSQMFLGFHDVEITFDHGAQTFASRFLVDVPVWGGLAGELCGAYVIDGGFVATQVHGQA